MNDLMMDDGIEASNKTPEPMQVDQDEEIIKEKPTKPPKTKIYDSDSDLSEGEREYLERRRRNTEWMEQIEKEREAKQKHGGVDKKKEEVAVKTKIAISSDEENLEERVKKVVEKDLNGSVVVGERVDEQQQQQQQRSPEGSPSAHVSLQILIQLLFIIVFLFLRLQWNTVIVCHQNRKTCYQLLHHQKPQNNY